MSGGLEAFVRFNACAAKQKGPAWRIAKRSVAGDDRAAPVEAVVHADFYDMIVGREAAERHQRRRCDEVAVTEIVVLIFGDGRPVRSEHVFQAGADRVAVGAIAAGRKRDWNAAERHALAVVGKGIAALDVDKSRSPSVADAAGHRAESALVVGVGESAGEDGADIAVEPAILGLRA